MATGGDEVPEAIENYAALVHFNAAELVRTVADHEAGARVNCSSSEALQKIGWLLAAVTGFVAMDGQDYVGSIRPRSPNLVQNPLCVSRVRNHLDDRARSFF